MEPEHDTFVSVMMVVLPLFGGVVALLVIGFCVNMLHRKLHKFLEDTKVVPNELVS